MGSPGAQTAVEDDNADDLFLLLESAGGVADPFAAARLHQGGAALAFALGASSGCKCGHHQSNFTRFTLVSLLPVRFHSPTDLTASADHSPRSGKRSSPPSSPSSSDSVTSGFLDPRRMLDHLGYARLFGRVGRIDTGTFLAGPFLPLVG